VLVVANYRVIVQSIEVQSTQGLVTIFKNRNIINSINGPYTLGLVSESQISRIHTPGLVSDYPKVTYSIFLICNALCLTFAYFFVVETKGSDIENSPIYAGRQKDSGRNSGNSAGARNSGNSSGREMHSMSTELLDARENQM
jgi:hypothetical protein